MRQRCWHRNPTASHFQGKAHKYRMDPYRYTTGLEILDKQQRLDIW
jgi:hypothetical protein